MPGAGGVRPLLRQHGLALVDALRRWVGRPAGHLAAAGVIALAIMLPLIGAALVGSAQRAASAIDPAATVTIFLSPSAPEGTSQDIGQALRGHAAAASVTFKPRAEALDDLRTRPAWADLLAELETNPLPDAFAVRLRDRDAATLQAVRAEWSKLPGVDRVLADTEWAETLTRVTRVAERVLAGIAVILGAAVLAVIAQLTRMQVVTRREEIELSQLLGATGPDVRRPFLWQGALLGMVAGGLACLAATGVTAWLGQEVRALTSLYSIDFKLEYLTLAQWLGVCALSGLLGLFGSGLAVSVELRRFAGHG